MFRQHLCDLSHRCREQLNALLPLKQLVDYLDRPLHLLGVYERVCVTMLHGAGTSNLVGTGFITSEGGAGVSPQTGPVLESQPPASHANVPLKVAQCRGS